MRCRDSKSAKKHRNKVGMIAQNSSAFNPTVHIFKCGKICRVGLYTELFRAIIPTLFLCFLLVYMYG